MHPSTFVSWRARLLLVGAALLMCACAGTPQKKTDIPPRPARETINAFQFDARAAIRYGQRAENVRIMWQHAPEADAIGFANPLGSVLAELQRDAQGARWITDSGERYDARTPDVLIARMTEVPVPIASLALWVVGRAGPSAQVLNRDPQGRPLSLQDKEWTISYLGYESEQPNALPSLIEAENGPLRIRLAIEEWLL
ncbi:lipoprotein insertase outer membrane protein LolB [Uliginosibacterium sp. H1]|uniref:lipoprotein insertase outer membrane protein LolB n=1 Tax=Uliginosibacterium sp. H1 TaxID=3114757 RepID=UPI002E1909A7|nr:lipoprotein insertase outer membrane protein LolB [Uliginosibacterium sp. H1]